MTGERVAGGAPSVDPQVERKHKWKGAEGLSRRHSEGGGIRSKRWAAASWHREDCRCSHLGDERWTIMVVGVQKGGDWFATWIYGFNQGLGL